MRVNVARRSATVILGVAIVVGAGLTLRAQDPARVPIETANKKFVADFRAKYRRYPSFYAAQAYDSAKLIDSAVAAVKGDLAKKEAMRMTPWNGGFPIRPSSHASIEYLVMPSSLASLARE